MSKKFTEIDNKENTNSNKWTLKDYTDAAKCVAEFGFYMGIMATGAFIGYKTGIDGGTLTGAIGGGSIAVLLQDLQNGEF